MGLGAIHVAVERNEDVKLILDVGHVVPHVDTALNPIHIDAAKHDQERGIGVRGYGQLPMGGNVNGSDCVGIRITHLDPSFLQSPEFPAADGLPRSVQRMRHVPSPGDAEWLQASSAAWASQAAPSFP